MFIDPASGEGVPITARFLRTSVRQRAEGLLLCGDAALYLTSSGTLHQSAHTGLIGLTALLALDTAGATARYLSQGWRELWSDLKRFRGMLRNGGVLIPQSDSNGDGGQTLPSAPEPS